MFLSADVLVKGVMIALALASLTTWTIAVSKSVEMSLARRRLQSSLNRISGPSRSPRRSWRWAQPAV